jgi:hypothetical protein
MRVLALVMMFLSALVAPALAQQKPRQDGPVRTAASYREDCERIAARKIGNLTGKASDDVFAGANDPQSDKKGNVTWVYGTAQVYLGSRIAVYDFSCHVVNGGILDIPPT